MLNKAHDAAINKGAAITTKRVSISKNPFEICKINTLYIIVYYLLNSVSLFLEKFFEDTNEMRSRRSNKREHREF